MQSADNPNEYGITPSSAGGIRPQREEFSELEPSPIEKEQDEDAVSREDFNQALSLIEQFVELKERLEEFRYAIPPRFQSELQALIDEYDTLVQVLDNEASPVKIVQNQPLSGLLKQNKIERLGLASTFIRLRREEKLSMRELARRYDVDVATVSRFFKYYDSLAPSQKSRYQRKDVFEVTERLQELQNYIIRNMHKLEGVKDEVAVKYVGEFRQVLELASKLAEKINNVREQERKLYEFKQAVHDILMNVCDEGQRNQVIQKLKELDVK